MAAMILKGKLSLRWSMIVWFIHGCSIQEGIKQNSTTGEEDTTSLLPGAVHHCWHSAYIICAWPTDWITRSHDREYNVSMNSYTSL